MSETDAAIADILARDPGEHLHRPIIRKLNPLSESQERYLVCEICGLALDFRPLEHMGVNTSDWELLV